MHRYEEYEDQDGNPKYIQTRPNGAETLLDVSKSRALHNIDVSLRRIADALEAQAKAAEARAKAEEELRYDPNIFRINFNPPPLPKIPTEIKKKYRFKPSHTDDSNAH